MLRQDCLQHSFRNGFSCDTQLVEFFHRIASSPVTGGQDDGVPLDVEKSVRHSFPLLNCQDAIDLRYSTYIPRMAIRPACWQKTTDLNQWETILPFGRNLTCASRLGSGSLTISSLHNQYSK